MSMDLILAAMAQCGECPRRQGNNGGRAHGDCEHAGNNQSGMRRATRAAEKGKASTVSNAVSPASPPWEHKTWQREIWRARRARMPK